MIKKFNINTLDLNNTGIGIKFPLSNDNRYFFGVNYTTLDQIKTNLLCFLQTGKGERIMIPEYGTNLSQLIFNNNDYTIIIDNLKTDLKKNFPYLTIETLSLEQDIYNEHIIKINLEFSMPGEKKIQNLETIYEI